MAKARRNGRFVDSKSLKLAAAAAAGSLALCLPARATITFNQINNSDWTMSNGLLNVVFSPSGGDLTSVKINGDNTQLLDTTSGIGHQILYQESAGTKFGFGGPQQFGFSETANYIDVWTTAPSNTAVSNNITFSYHYVLFNNDPAVHAYEVLNHSSTDPAISVGQGQFLARVNPNLFPNTYQLNVGVNNPGAQQATPNDSAGPQVQDATTDVSASGLPGDWGNHFYTKYDYSSYIQFWQGQTEYGPQYTSSVVIPSTDTLTGGPTKQSLMFTNNINMAEFLSGHYGDTNYSYTPAQGQDTTRLFGPFAFRFTDTNGESAAQLYNDAISTAPVYTSAYQSDSELTSAGVGYVPESNRGSVQINALNSAGWSNNLNYNTVVLSDPNKMFQESTTGYQYWTQLSSSGSASISNVVPGTYRLSMYELGQWGETRVDGVQVTANNIDIPKNLKFIPENFSSFAPIFTIGTPDRSSHEFLNGYATNANTGIAPGADIRQFQGSYDYWQEMANEGTPGYVNYYATPEPGHPISPANTWIANMWHVFNPTGYTAPAYVTAAGGAANYTGSSWQVHFNTTQAQLNQGAYVVLTVGMAAAEGDLGVELNSNNKSTNWEIWRPTDKSDPSVRSGDAGVYQMVAFQFPVADLLAAGQDNIFYFSTANSTYNGVMFDAVRMEITNTSANPSTTHWFDYDWVTNSTTQTNSNNATGNLVTTNSFVTQTALVSNTGIWNSPGGGSWATNGQWLAAVVPQSAGDVANFTSAIQSSSNIDLGGGAFTVATLNFNNTKSYTLTNGSIILNNGSSGAVVNDLGGSHTIAASVAMNSNTNFNIANTGDTLTLSNTISGSGNLTVTGTGTLSLSGSNNYTGATLIAPGPTLAINAAGALPANTTVVNAGNLQINAASVAVNLTGAGSLTIGTATTPASLQLAPGGGVSYQSSVNINPGSSLDITNNTFIVSFGSAADPVSNIRQALQSAYGGGLWTGTGLTSSAVAAQAASVVGTTNGIWSIAYFDGNTDPGSIAAPGTIVIEPALAGDALFHGAVDFNDLLVLAQNVGSTNADWAHADFNFDGIVDFKDLLIYAQNVNHTNGTTPLSQELPASFKAQLQLAFAEIRASESPQSVPEPAAGALIGLASTLMLRRRARRIK